MTKLHPKGTSIASLVVLFALAHLSSPLTASLLAQSSGQSEKAGRSEKAEKPETAALFPLPTSVPVGTVIQIGGSSSMATINQALKKRFEQKFAGTKVNLNTQGTGAALKDLIDGNADLAAIGRPLTDQEKAQRLVAVPVSRHKIAIVIGAENPFKGGLTFEQFAKIARGEIKNWSQVGGVAKPIRFIDRPNSSDTRQALRNYPVFKKAPVATEGKIESTTEQLAQDSTSQLIQALGKDGIGYAIADQLAGHIDIRIVPVHKTLPSSPKYPFSQPLIYVYKGPQPNPVAQAFLGYATAPVSRSTIEAARKEEAKTTAIGLETASPNPQATATPPTNTAVPTPAPETTASPATSSSNPGEIPVDKTVPPWAWWLGMPLLGGLFWWLFSTNRSKPEAAFEGIPEPTDDADPPTDADVPAEQTLPAEIKAALIEPVAPLLEVIQPLSNSHLTLVPRDCKDVDAFWEVADDVTAALQQQGARKLILRLYDVTDIDLTQHPPLSLQEFECDASVSMRQLPIRTDDRDYLAELGYVAEDGRWLSIVRSEPVRVPACSPSSTPVDVGEATIADEPLPPSSSESPSTSERQKDESNVTQFADEVKTAGAPLADQPLASRPLAEESVVQPFANQTATDRAADRPPIDHTPIVTTPEANQSLITLVPRSPQAAYVQWQVSQIQKETLRHQGGQQLRLRVYEATALNLTETPANVQQFDCTDWEQEQLVPIPVSNLDYIAELGYATADGRWLSLARSQQTRVPGA